jgi:hypothetical protein
MVLGPTILYEGFPVQNLVEKFFSYGLYQECGFWPPQFEEVIDKLVLLLDIIVYQRTRVRAMKALAVFFFDVA